VPQHLDRASTSLWFGYALFPLFFCRFFPLLPLFFSILLLGSSVFPLLSLVLCLVPRLSLYFPYIFLSILSTTYRSYLRIVLHYLCLRSFTGRLILRRISILTTLVGRTIIHTYNCCGWKTSQKQGYMFFQDGIKQPATRSNTDDERISSSYI